MTPYCDRLSGAQSGVLLPPTVSPKTNTEVQLGVDYVQNTGGRGKASHMHVGPPTPRASLTHSLQGVQECSTIDPLNGITNFVLAYYKIFDPMQTLI